MITPVDLTQGMRQDVAPWEAKTWLIEGFDIVNNRLVQSPRWRNTADMQTASPYYDCGGLFESEQGTAWQVSGYGRFQTADFLWCGAQVWTFALNARITLQHFAVPTFTSALTEKTSTNAVALGYMTDKTLGGLQYVEVEFTAAAVLKWREKVSGTWSSWVTGVAVTETTVLESSSVKLELYVLPNTDGDVEVEVGLNVNWAVTSRPTQFEAHEKTNSTGFWFNLNFYLCHKGTVWKYNSVVGAAGGALFCWVPVGYWGVMRAAKIAHYYNHMLALDGYFEKFDTALTGKKTFLVSDVNNYDDYLITDSNDADSFNCATSIAGFCEIGNRMFIYTADRVDELLLVGGTRVWLKESRRAPEGAANINGVVYGDGVCYYQGHTTIWRHDGETFVDVGRPIWNLFQYERRQAWSYFYDRAALYWDRWTKRLMFAYYGGNKTSSTASSGPDFLRMCQMDQQGRWVTRFCEYARGSLSTSSIGAGQIQHGSLAFLSISNAYPDEGSSAEASSRGRWLFGMAAKVMVEGSRFEPTSGTARNDGLFGYDLCIDTTYSRSNPRVVFGQLALPQQWETLNLNEVYVVLGSQTYDSAIVEVFDSTLGKLLMRRTTTATKTVEATYQELAVGQLVLTNVTGSGLFVSLSFTGAYNVVLTQVSFNTRQAFAS